MEDELAVRRVLAEYCHRIDDGDMPGVAALFTDGGAFAFRGDEARGTAALIEWFERSYPPHRRGRHLTVNVVVDVAGETASARSDYAVVRFIRGALTFEAVGRYRDELVRSDAGWRLRRRDADMLEGRADG